MALTLTVLQYQSLWRTLHGGGRETNSFQLLPLHECWAAFLVREGAFIKDRTQHVHHAFPFREGRRQGTFDTVRQARCHFAPRWLCFGGIGPPAGKMICENGREKKNMHVLRIETSMAIMYFQP